MKKIICVSLLSLFFFFGNSQKVDSASIVLTDSTQFVSLSNIRELDAWLKKTLTYDEYMKVHPGLQLWINNKAAEFLSRKNKKK